MHKTYRIQRVATCPWCGRRDVYFVRTRLSQLEGHTIHSVRTCEGCKKVGKFRVYHEEIE